MNKETAGECKKRVQKAREDLENILNLLPEISPIVVYISSVIINYERGKYNKKEFLNKMTWVIDTVLDSGGE